MTFGLNGLTSYALGSFYFRHENIRGSGLHCFRIDNSGSWLRFLIIWFPAFLPGWTACSFSHCASDPTRCICWPGGLRCNRLTKTTLRYRLEERATVLVPNADQPPEPGIGSAQIIRITDSYWHFAQNCFGAAYMRCDTISVCKVNSSRNLSNNLFEMWLIVIVAGDSSCYYRVN